MGVKLVIDGSLKEKLEVQATRLINKKLAEVLGEVVPLTPVGKSISGRTEKNRLVREGKAVPRKGYTGGRLRKGWAVIPAAVVGDGRVAGYLYNSVHYASHVNYGHRTRLGMSRTGKKTDLYRKDGTPKKRYVKGRYFLQKALAKCGFKVRRYS